jgi:flagellar basal body-associated protein FliL
MSVSDWVIIAVLIVAIVVAVFGLDRYRGSRKNAASSGEAQPTSEVFTDPDTGKRTRVWYNPATGEREYRAE